jgi:hypothetical protein
MAKVRLARGPARVDTASQPDEAGMPGDDFPPLPAPAEGSPTLALDVEVLQELVASSEYAAQVGDRRRRQLITVIGVVVVLGIAMLSALLASC